MSLRQQNKVFLLEATDGNGGTSHTCKSEDDAIRVANALEHLDNQIQKQAAQVEKSFGNYDPTNIHEHKRGMTMGQRVAKQARSDWKALKKFAHHVEQGEITVEEAENGEPKFLVDNAKPEAHASANTLLRQYGIDPHDAEKIQQQAEQHEAAKQNWTQTLKNNERAKDFIQQRVKAHAAAQGLSTNEAAEELKQRFYNGEEGGIPGKYVKGTENNPKGQRTTLSAEQRNAWVAEEKAKEGQALKTQGQKTQGREGGKANEKEQQPEMAMA